MPVTTCILAIINYKHYTYSEYTIMYGTCIQNFLKVSFLVLNILIHMYKLELNISLNTTGQVNPKINYLKHVKV